jgi:hypothetical protein
MIKRVSNLGRVAHEVDRILLYEEDTDLAQRVADLRSKKTSQLRAIVERDGAETNSGMAAGYLLYMQQQQKAA